VSAETTLEMVERHVRQSERHIARQHEMIAEMKRDGHNTDSARDFLRLLLISQASHNAHLARLKLN
jgi:hypothetical protein